MSLAVGSSPASPPATTTTTTTTAAATRSPTTTAATALATGALEAPAAPRIGGTEALAARASLCAVHAGGPTLPYALEGAGSSSPLTSELAAASELPCLPAAHRRTLGGTAAPERALLAAAAGHLLPSLGGAAPEGLARLHVPRTRLVEALLRRGVAILRALAMLRIVLPLPRASIALAAIALTAIALIMLDALVRDVRVVHVVGVAVVIARVDVDVAAAPVAVAPERTAHGHAETEGEEGGARHVA